MMITWYERAVERHDNNLYDVMKKQGENRMATD